MKPATVLVSDATRNPGLALIRELGRAGFDVHGADARQLPLGLHSRYSPAYLDYGSSSGVELAEVLLDIVRELRPGVFLPVSTALTRVVSERRSEFEALTGVNVPRFESFATAMNNDRTLQTCTELGIPCPRSLDLSEAAELLQSSTEPSSAAMVVIKPRMDLGAARGVRYVTSMQALEDGIEANSRRFGESVLQEFIPGDVTAMRLVLLLFDRGGQLLAYLTARKLLQWPEQGGLSAVAVSTQEPELVRQVLPFFEHLGWQGPAEAELKVDPRDGIPKLIEVNPRMPSYVGFPERCGIPLARMMAEAASTEWSGEICPSYPAGVRFLRSGEVLKILLNRLRGKQNRAASLGQALAQIGRGTRPASLDWSDPLPRVGKLLSELADLATSDDSGSAGNRGD